MVFIRIAGLGTAWGGQLTLEHALQLVKQHLPLAIFVLYGSTEEHHRFLATQAAEGRNRYQNYYFLEHSEDARATSERRGRIPRFRTAFISYNHEDDAFAQWLHEYFMSFGIECWLDRKELKAGDMIHRSVEAAREGRDKLLLCASEHSLQIWWVDNEINNAILKEQEPGRAGHGDDLCPHTVEP